MNQMKKCLNKILKWKHFLFHVQCSVVSLKQFKQYSYCLNNLLTCLLLINNLGKGKKSSLEICFIKGNLCIGFQWRLLACEHLLQNVMSPQGDKCLISSLGWLRWSLAEQANCISCCVEPSVSGMIGPHSRPATVLHEIPKIIHVLHFNLFNLYFI